MKAFFCFAAAVTCLSALGQTPEVWKEIDSAGRILKNAKVVKVMPNGLRILHDAGMETVPWMYLPEDLKKIYATPEALATAGAAAAAETLRKQQDAVAMQAVAQEKEIARLYEFTGQPLDIVRRAVLTRDWCIANPGGGVANDQQISQAVRDDWYRWALGVVNSRPGMAQPTVAAVPAQAANPLARGAPARGLGGVAPSASGRGYYDPERIAEREVKKGRLPGASGGGAIESWIDGDFDGWDGETVVKLMNGQVWQQTDFHLEYHIAISPRVLIYLSSGGYKMKVDGVREDVRVQQLR